MGCVNMPYMSWVGLGVRHTVGVLVCLPAGLIKQQEGDVLESLELFQRTVTLSPSNSSAVKQVA